MTSPRSVTLETCPRCSGRAPYCDECRLQRVSWHLGNAKALGAWWAEKVRASGWRGTWRTYDESARVRELAAARVQAIAAGDQDLLELFARACAEVARAEWMRPPPPGLTVDEMLAESGGRVQAAASWAPRGRRLPVRRAVVDLPVSDAGELAAGELAEPAAPPRARSSPSRPRARPR